MHHRIFQRDPFDGSIPASREQRHGFVQVGPQVPLVQPPDTGIAEAGAGRVADNQQIPAVGQMVAHVALDVPVRRLVGGQQVALPCIVAAREEGIEGNARRGAADQDAEGLCHGVHPSR